MNHVPTTFEELSLLPGHVFQLALDGYVSDRGKASLLGYYHKHSLMITAPIISGAVSLLNTGTGVTVRMFVPNLGCVCAFRTEVMHSSRQPYPFIHLSMPKDIVVGEVRRSARAKVSVSVRIFYGDEFASEHKAVMNDLSVGGASLHVEQPLVPTGEPVKIRARVVVEGIERELNLNAIVRAADYDNEQKNISVQFMDVSENDRIVLYAYVLTHLQR